MTTWLQWRLGALLGTALLIGGATYLHAQSNYPAPPKTPEEAGTLFFRLLSSGGYRDNPSYGSEPYMERADSALNSISRQQVQSFSNRYHNGGIESFLLLLAQEMNEPQYEGRVSGTEGGQTIVEVSPSTSKNRQVVVIAEDGGYRVDLKATYAKWNNLSGEKLDEQWYKFTGVASPALMQNGNFLRSQCQSNLKQQMLAVFQYAQDYDERLPPAREWVDVLQPYIKSEQVFQCPALSKGGNGNGYAYNQYLSRATQPAIAELAKTINIYETSNPKRNWFGPGTGRAYRHQDGWNLAFADGHVKWFKQGQPTDLPFKPVLSPSYKGTGRASITVGAP